MKNERNKIAKAVVWGLIGSFLCGIVAGCAKTQTPDDSGKTKKLSAQYQKETQAADGEVSEEFCAAYVDFSFNLLREGRKSRNEAVKNTFVSPLSVMTALEMAGFGADGETEKQIDAVLYEGLSGEEGRKNLVAFADGLTNEEDASFIEANSIWLRTGKEAVKPKEDFLEKNGVDFGADIFSAPFDEETVEDINDWVNEKTEGNIKEILNQIPEEAQMYLINASSFDAKWQEIYRETDITEDEVFTCADGSEKTVAMMNSEENRYLYGEKETGFRKPYAEGYSFVALLPEEGITIDDYVNQLDGETFLKLLKEEEDAKVITHLPEFKADTALELSDVLSSLGMPLAFDKEKAEFPRIFEDSAEKVWINRVLHKTHIEVDAQGTKAGAVTAVEIAALSAAPGQEQPKEVYLNRPFVYAIVDDDTNLPIFIGVAEDIGK